MWATSWQHPAEHADDERCVGGGEIKPIVVHVVYVVHIHYPPSFVVQLSMHAATLTHVRKSPNAPAVGVNLRWRLVPIRLNSWGGNRQQLLDSCLKRGDPGFERRGGLGRFGRRSLRQRVQVQTQRPCVLLQSLADLLGADSQGGQREKSRTRRKAKGRTDHTAFSGAGAQASERSGRGRKRIFEQSKSERGELRPPNTMLAELGRRFNRRRDEIQ